MRRVVIHHQHAERIGALGRQADVDAGQGAILVAIIHDAIGQWLTASRKCFAHRRLERQGEGPARLFDGCAQCR